MEPIDSLMVHVAFHRDFPEIRALGESPKAAALHLAGQVADSLESGPDSWHRSDLEHALADLRAYSAPISEGSMT
jgi:hypothetical protein